MSNHDYNCLLYHPSGCVEEFSLESDGTLMSHDSGGWFVVYDSISEAEKHGRVSLRSQSTYNIIRMGKAGIEHALERTYNMEELSESDIRKHVSELRCGCGCTRYSNRYSQYPQQACEFGMLLGALVLIREQELRKRLRGGVSVSVDVSR